MGQSSGKDDGQTVKKTSYVCSQCTQTISVDVYPEWSRQIQEHYANPDNGGINMNFLNTHRGTIDGKEGVEHTMRVGIDVNLTTRGVYPAYMLLAPQGGEKGVGKYSTIQERDDSITETVPDRFVYPDYQKAVLGRTHALYRRAKEKLNDKELPEDLQLKSVLKLNKTFQKYKSLVDEYKSMKETGNDSRGRPVKDLEAAKQKYEALIAKNKPLVEQYDKVMKTEILRYEGLDENAADLSETITYKQVIDELERWNARIHCEKKKLNAKNEIVWFEVYKPQDVLIKIKNRGKKRYGTPIHAFPQQKLTTNSEESIIGSLNKIFSNKANAAENDPFFVWAYLFDDDVQKLQGVFENTLYSTELVAQYARNYGTIDKTLKDKQFKDLSKEAPITISELNKTRSRKQWAAEMERIERDALVYTKYSLESVGRTKSRFRSWGDHTRGELAIGAGALGGGIAMVPIREYLLTVYDLENQFFHFAQEIGSEPSAAQTLAHELVEFGEKYMPVMIAGAITTGAVALAFLAKHELKKRSNLDKYGIDIGFADYAELSNLVRLNESIREERETTLVNFFPERPDLFLKNLDRWDDRLSKGKLVKQVPTRR